MPSSDKMKGVLVHYSILKFLREIGSSYHCCYQSGWNEADLVIVDSCAVENNINDPFEDGTSFQLDARDGVGAHSFGLKNWKSNN